MQRLLRKVLRAVADRDPDYYDMYADANEQWYAKLYLERILRHAREAGILPPARVLDAGCQAGRLAVPMARLGYEVTGIDTSGFALRRAREHARAEGVRARFLRGDILKVLGPSGAGRYDLVLCAEVVYLAREFRLMLARLAGAVRPGGLLCVSHRPRSYYLVEALRAGDAAAAAGVRARTEGPFRDSAYYNWQTVPQLRGLYRELGLDWLAMYPIERFGWLGGARPADLSADEREQWLRRELELTERDGPLARYLLVISRPSRLQRNGALP
jgi:SAM-dependent methyltransferase